MNNPSAPNPEKLSRLPERPRAHFDDVILPGLAIGSGALLFAATPDLIGAESIGDYLKSGLISLIAAGVAYGVNKAALQKGTVQAAIGTRGALFLSVASISIVGLGLFASTTAGLTLARIDDLRQAEYVRDVSVYAAAETDAVQQAARIEPALKAVSADFEKKARCERLSSCLSGRGSGGAGTVFRAATTQHQQAEAILAEVLSGAEARDQHLEAMRMLQSEAQQVLFDDALSSDARRIALQEITVRLEQRASALRQSVPTALVAAYADNLMRGKQIPDRPEATQTLSNIMQGHGQTLRAVAGGSGERITALPRFPAKSGVTDSLNYLGHFLPIAMIVAVVELIFPLTLWLYTYFGLCARLEQESVDAPKKPARKPTKS